MEANTGNPVGQPAVTGFNVPYDNPPDEFDQFKNLTSKLVKVPKSELDEKRAES